jgi:hypothetical protein
MRLDCISKLNSSLFLLTLIMFWWHLIKLLDSLFLLFIANSIKYPHFLVLSNFYVFLIFYISPHYDLCLNVCSTFLLVQHNYWLKLHMWFLIYLYIYLQFICKFHGLIFPSHGNALTHVMIVSNNRHYFN